MKSIQTEISIKSSAMKIWEVLTDFENHSLWNPFFESIEGEQWVGGVLTVRMKQQNGKSMTFKPVIAVYENATKLIWKGQLFMPGLFDGEHGFSIIENRDGTSLFKQWETFGGILLPIFGQKLLDDTKKSFEDMNEALKEYVEALAGRDKRKMSA